MFSLFAVHSSRAQNDSVMYQRDSAVVTEEQDCYDRFFAAAEKPSMPGKTLLVQKNGKITTLAAWIRNYKGGDFMGVEPQYGLADLDHDGKKELVVFGYTGGAHCCDEFYFFKNAGANKYQYAAKTFAGNVCVSDSNEFEFSFYEQFGYFFTCYACAYEDTSDGAPLPIHSIRLRYYRGKLLVTAPPAELRAQINDNLGKLGEQPYEKLEDETSFDNGLRKEFAMNLAVYYYSFGKNLIETQKLFNKYYKFPDAKKVWAAFVKQLQWVRSSSEF